ncbi:MAG: putative T7SS-secreted protein, partial [Streptomyces sp.]
MGWDLVPDSWEDAAENTVEKVGDGVDYASDWTADRMDDAGMHSGANWVRDKGGSVANALGADVGELQLGQTDDEKKLVHGSPEKLRTTAGHLTDFKTAFTNVGNGLKGLDSQHMKGKAADAFREKVAVEPKKWFKAADACEKAATALKDFAGTVQWAQGEAKEAITQYKKGKDASDGYESKRTAYNDAVDTYNAKPADQRDPSSLPAKPGETDPGAADMKAAQEKLDEARRQRNEASGTARTAVQAARDAAPDKPSYSEQVKDGLVGLALDYEHLQGGIIKGTAGVLTFVRSVNPTDPYNLTHPAEYATTLNNTAAGLVRMANDPVGTAKTMYDTFKKDPAEGIGRLIPELLGTRGLGAVKKVATVAKHLPDSKTPGRKDVGDKPDDKCREPACRREGREPVDFATGRMVLRQTDVSLPGSLPLVFRRGFESSYRAGRWFGPTWSSTIDQRLEIDAEGVIFHGEDNLLLAYPHPAPEVPTLPVTGPRWPLERTVEGDYILNDPDTGQVRHFTGPAGGADGTALLEQITDRNDHRINFEYTPDGAPTSVVHDGRYHLKLTTENGRITALHLARAAEDGTDQQLKRYGYTDGHLTSVTNSSGLPLQFGCDDAGRMTSWTDTNGSHFDFAYDEEDRCVWQSGTEGHMRSTFDYSGVDERTGYRITKVTDSLGHTWRYLVNDRLQVVAETEPTGATTRSEWDRYNRLLSRTDALGRATRYRYGEVGEVQAVTRPDGQTIEAEYNHLGLPVAITGVDGACWRQEYDERGNRTAVTDPAGHTTRYAYGEQNHLTAVTDALGSTVQVRCDPAGLPVQITDPGGAVTTYARDAFGRPTAVVDPLEGTTRLSWTVEELSRRLDPDGSGESWIYDGEGNCTRHVDAGGGVTTFEYTHFDLLAAQTGPDGVRHEFTHDTELRLTQVTNPHGLSWSYAYDPAGRLLSETDFDDRTLTYEHDAAGQLASRTNPLGLRVTFERDVLGQITSKDADGQATTYAYDPAGRLTEAVGPDAELLLQRDKLGRIKTELVNGRALTHTYDALGRRTRRMTPSGAVSSFTYDAVGNRTTLTAAGHTLDFTHDAAGRETHRRIAGTMDMAHTWD